MKRERAKGRIVALIGIDGSGKTSVAKKMASEIGLSGRKVSYVYARFTPRISKPVISAISAVLGTKPTSSPAIRTVERGKKRGLIRRWPISSLQEAVFLLDYILQLGSEVLSLHRRGDVLICDRYFHDTILTDLAPDLGWSREVIDRKVRTLMNFLPRPDVLILLTVDPEVAFARKNDVPDIEYLTERAILYKETAEKLGATIIDANGPFERVYAEALGTVERDLTILGEKPMARGIEPRE